MSNSLKSVIKKIEKNNNTIKYNIINADKIRIENLWNDESLYFIFNLRELKKISNILFIEQLVAFYNYTDSTIEFIFSTVTKEEYEMYRRINFEIFYNGFNFICEFKKPSNEFWNIVSASRKKSPISDSEYRNLGIFKAYKTVIDKKINSSKEEDKEIKEIFENLKPINFFVTVPNDFLNAEDINEKFIELSKYLNFYFNFLDREFPKIIILNKKFIEKNKFIPIKNKLEKKINSVEIDSFLLDIYNFVMTSKNNILKFILLYQILEYYSFYSLAPKERNKVKKILSKPDLHLNLEENLNNIIDILTNTHKTDEQKITDLIINTVDYEFLYKEFEQNKQCFKKDVILDGGFEISKFDVNSIEDLTSNIDKLRKQITTIRNAIVHLREKRQEQGIIITERNNHLIAPWVFILQRIVELAMINYKSI